jgi:hypothetical protein
MVKGCVCHDATQVHHNLSHSHYRNWRPVELVVDMFDIIAIALGYFILTMLIKLAKGIK